MLQIDSAPGGCPVLSVDGKGCKTACRRLEYAYFIEPGDQEPPGIALVEENSDRHVV